jgi:glyoxylase-like metal-dependent hydrolase (beta-lactamase superfamily II)
MNGPRVLNAGNRGPFALDGTRTFILGSRHLAIVDPGPDLEGHLQAILSAVAPSGRKPDSADVLVTHGHTDHGGLAPALLVRLKSLLRESGGRVRLLGPGPPAETVLQDGGQVHTDEGDLVALQTPGHTRDHLAFHWPERRALFAGDLVLGEGSSTWVGEYAGCVADYLRSLDRIESLGLELIYPAHGPPIRNVPEVIQRYRSHREERIAQVDEALRSDPGASPEQLLAAVYGRDLPGPLRAAALRSIEAIVHHLIPERPIR